MPNAARDMIALYATEEPIQIRDKSKQMMQISRREFKGSFSPGCIYIAVS
jgi:hypothetical protein